jgi:negative regulator of sigma E activity
MKSAGMNNGMAMDATDLTQLSSREQLSALMDGALPADETRFLLRRLQHDASLAECWERWRLSADVMRGLAPAQRLPADFASRVASALRGEDPQREGGIDPSAATGTRVARMPAWLRWGGGAAVAASLVAVAFMTQPVALESPGNLPGNTSVAVADAVPSSAAAASHAQAPGRKMPTPQEPVQAPAGTGIESQTAPLATAVAVVSRPARNNRRGSPARARQAASMSTLANHAPSADIGIAGAGDIPPLLPQGDIATRPWPRSVLPQYGNAGITVGFGDGTRAAAPYNPFQMRTRIGDLPPALMTAPAANEARSPEHRTSDADDATDAANAEPPQP